MPLDFPNDPAVGDIFAGAGARWQWDGFKWTSLMTSGGPFLPLSGGALTGPLMLAADPVVALHAATKQYVDARGAGYLPLTGGTLAGPLTVEGVLEVTTGHLQLINDGSTEDAFAYVDLSADIGGMNLIRGHSPGFAQTWWTLALGDGPPSADFSITRYNDAGGIIDHPLTISRATGVVTFGPIPPSTMRRLGEAPAVTATAGVGSLQGHPVNGTVIQGSGSTNDFQINNKSGAAALSVPTGTVNLFAPGTLTMSGARVQGAAITRGMSLFSNFQGAYTGANNVIANLNLSITADSVVTGAAGGLFNLYCGETINASTVTGNRTCIGAILNFTGQSANNVTPGKYYVAAAGIATASAPDNGTASVSCGKLFGANFSAELTAGSTYWSDCWGMEIDVGVDTGASCAYKGGLKIVLFHNDAVRGTITDVGLAFALQQQVGVTTPGFLHGISFSQSEGWWPFGNDSTLIGTEVPSVGGPAMVAAFGIDLSAVSFVTAFLKSNGFLVDGNGNVVAASITAPNVAAPSATNPLMNGAVAIGTAATFARADHVHPSDTARLALAGGTMTGALGLAGVNFASVAASSSSDLSKHIELYSSNFGFCVTAARLNYNIPAGSSHVFVVAGADAVSISAAGITGPIGSTTPTTAAFTTLRVNGNAGFNNTAPIAKPTVSGAKASNAALASLIAALANYGLITDTTTA